MNAASITRLEAVKNQFANEEGYGSWEEFTYIKGYPKDIDEMVDTIAERFLHKQCSSPATVGQAPVIRPEEIKAHIDKAATQVRENIHNTMGRKLALVHTAFQKASIGIQELVEATKPKPKITVAQAMETVTAELSKDKSDGSYYHGWQSNIAMAIYDEFGPMNDDTYKEFIHKKANAAARRFLDSVLAPRCTQKVSTLRTSDGLLMQLIEILGCKHRSPEESKVLEEAKQYFRDKQNTEGRV